MRGIGRKNTSKNVVPNGGGAFLAAPMQFSLMPAAFVRPSYSILYKPPWGLPQCYRVAYCLIVHVATGRPCQAERWLRRPSEAPAEEATAPSDKRARQQPEARCGVRLLVGWLGPRLSSAFSLHTCKDRRQIFSIQKLQYVPSWHSIRQDCVGQPTASTSVEDNFSLGLISVYACVGVALTACRATNTMI
jgi:hypothetical protein